MLPVENVGLQGRTGAGYVVLLGYRLGRKVKIESRVTHSAAQPPELDVRQRADAISRRNKVIAEAKPMGGRIKESIRHRIYPLEGIFSESLKSENRSLYFMETAGPVSESASAAR